MIRSFWILVALLIVELPFGVFLFSETESPPLSQNQQQMSHVDSKQLLDMFQKQLKQIREGNIAQAYREFTSKEFQQATSLEDFESFLKNFTVLTKNKSLKIHALFFENNTGTIQGVLTSESGESLNVDYDVIEENGQWKIMGIQLFKHGTDKPAPRTDVPAQLSKK